MPSHRLCLRCGAITERGENYCHAHARRWPGGLGSDWPPIRNAYLKAHPRCERCGGRAVTVDHIVARAFGGTHDQANLQALCPRCAAAKDRADQREGMRRKRDTPWGGGSRT